MDEYISREAIVKEIKKEIKACDMKFVEDIQIKKGLKIALKDIKVTKTADVQPVKHGYWIKQPEKFQIYEDVINSNYLYSCSCCNASDLHSERANNDGEVKFCWRCGARMDGDAE